MYKILKNDKNKEENCCGFRKIQIFDIPGAVGTSIKMYNPTAPQDIDVVMNDLICYINRDDGKFIDAAKSVKTNMLLLELLRQKPIIDIKETAKELNMAYNTVAKSVVDLQEMGILVQSNNLLRNRCFVYVKYLNIIMDETNVDD